MLGLFGTLNLGARSLSVQQEGTEVAGQNLANVNTPGYSRQQLVVQTSTPLPTPAGVEGTGIQVATIAQVRSALLDSQIQSESSVTGSLNAQQLALQDAETNLGEQLSTSSTDANGDPTSTSSTGLAADLTNLFGSFQTLSTAPTSLAQRQVVVGDAQQLASQFNQVSSQLSSVRDGLNTSIQNDVAGANQDLTDIANLNQQIILAQQSGATANDLIDSREQDIEDLASKVNITATVQANGGTDIAIGGVTMVSGSSTPDSLQAYDAGGGQFLVQAKNAGTPLTLTGGSIQGDIDVRDGALANLQGGVNTLASQLISQVNSIYSGGYDLNGNTSQDFFTGAGASDIGVNSALVQDPSQFQASGSSTATGDNTVALALAQLAEAPVSSLANQTLSQNYSQTVTALGSALSSVNDQVTNSSSVSQMLANQRSSVSGVSIDEEMTNLMEYQKAYQASAELITTVNEMLVTLIAMKTV